LHIYWLTTNLFSVGQTAFFKSKRISKAFDIPQINDPESIERLEFQARNNFQPPFKPKVLLTKKPKLENKSKN
jgi:membrane protein insertase Oxa1/YidC/SpoIIIJ